MKSEIRYRPAFASIFLELEGQDHLIAETNAMASMSSKITFDTRPAGSFFTGLCRWLGGGESFFVNDFSVSDGSSAELVLTRNTPGDIACLELDGKEMFFQPGAFIACTPEIKIGTQFAGFKSFIAREGLFRLRVSGRGKVWFGAFGGLIEKEIRGEYIVDTAHLVAYEPQISLNIQTASSGLFSSFFSGEGLVSRLQGEGKIYLQSRSLNGLAGWINPKLW